MSIDGWYYLHQNGCLIYKRNLGEGSMPEPSSPFVRRIWPIDISERALAWFIAIEAGALGVKKERIQELAQKWGLTDEDAEEFASHTGQFKIFKDGDTWCATFKDFTDLQESQCGFGKTALEAFIELAKPGLEEKDREGRLEKLAW